MFRNFFMTAWRTTLNNKLHSFINISGLAIGIAVTLLIGLWVFHESSYDRFLPGYERVYQVNMNITIEGQTRTQSAVALPLADKLRRDIPDIQYVAESDWDRAAQLKGRR